MGTRRDPLGISAWRNVAHRTVSTSRAPVHSVLVQKSVTTITNFAGRLYTWMLGNGASIRKSQPAKSWQLVCSSATDSTNNPGDCARFRVGEIHSCSLLVAGFVFQNSVQHMRQAVCAFRVIQIPALSLAFEHVVFIGDIQRRQH